jgi:hypothetical protein
MNLANHGGFVVKLQFVYYDLENGEKYHVDGSGDILLGQSHSEDPGDHGVPDGALIALYAFVVWGYDNEAKQLFTYRRGDPNTAYYTIDGTTLSNNLGLIRVDS